MISCTEFIPAYSELFKYLQKIGGKAAVVRFWEYHSDNVLGNLKSLVEAKGIRDYQITVSQGISPILIQWKGIEAAEKLAESPNAKVIIFGDSKIPVILGGQ